MGGILFSELGWTEQSSGPIGANAAYLPLLPILYLIGKQTQSLLGLALRGLQPNMISLHQAGAGHSQAR